MKQMSKKEMGKRNAINTVMNDINAAKNLFTIFSCIYVAIGLGLFVCLFLKANILFYIPVIGIAAIVACISMYNYNCVLTKHGTLDDVLKLIKGN